MYNHVCKWCGNFFQTRWMFGGFCSKDCFVFWGFENCDAMDRFHMLVDLDRYLLLSDLYFKDWSEHNNYKLSVRKCSSAFIKAFYYEAKWR